MCRRTIAQNTERVSTLPCHLASRSFLRKNHAGAKAVLQLLHVAGLAPRQRCIMVEYGRHSVFKAARRLEGPSTTWAEKNTPRLFVM